MGVVENGGCYTILERKFKGENMMRTIVFHPYGYHKGAACTYQETRELIDNPQKDFVQTTQMCFLSTKLFKEGFDFIIIFGMGKNIFISIDDDGQIYCPDIQYKLTKNHNLFKLWQRGEFK